MLVQGETAQPQPDLQTFGEPIEHDDGSVSFEETEEEPLALSKVPHDGNLAEAMNEHELATIASDLIEGIEADDESNAEMRDIFAKGMQFVIVRPGARMDTPFPGAAGVIHPLLLEALVRFAANALGELLPAGGPVKTIVNGDDTPDKEVQAERKRDWMNYYLTQKDEDYYPDFDQMNLLTGYYGSMFRKVYRDPAKRGMPVSRSLSPQDLIVAYAATSLHGSGRVTHVERDVIKADITRLQLKGWYREVELQQGEGETDDDNPAREAEGREKSTRTEDATFKLYHCHCLLDIRGLEHLGADGEPSGLPLPYIVTIEPESRQILRIARNWNQGDAEFAPRELRPLQIHARLRLLWLGSRASAGVNCRRADDDASAEHQCADA